MENKINLNYEPYEIFEEESDSVFYMGIARQSATNIACWKIKKMWKINNIWKSGFPEGKQCFDYIWDNRKDYTYE